MSQLRSDRLVNEYARSGLPAGETPLVLTAKQQETLRFLHRNVKGSYLQLTALLDELDILNQK